MLIEQFPEIREFEGMQRSYKFVLDFLEVVATKTNELSASHQLSIKKLLEASKISEKAVDKLLEIETAKVIFIHPNQTMQLKMPVMFVVYVTRLLSVLRL